MDIWISWILRYHGYSDITDILHVYKFPRRLDFQENDTFEALSTLSCIAKLYILSIEDISSFLLTCLYDRLMTAYLKILVQRWKLLLRLANACLPFSTRTTLSANPTGKKPSAVAAMVPGRRGKRGIRCILPRDP